jgi:hypothetical protein
MWRLRCLLLAIIFEVVSGQYFPAVPSIESVLGTSSMRMTKNDQTFSFTMFKVPYQSSAQFDELNPEIPMDNVTRSYTYPSSKNCIIFPLNKLTGNLTVSVDKSSCLTPAMMITQGLPSWTISSNSFSIVALNPFWTSLFNENLKTHTVIFEEPYASKMSVFLYSSTFEYSKLITHISDNYFSIFCLAYTTSSNQRLVFNVSATPRVENQTITYSSSSDLEKNNNFIYVPFEAIVIIQLPRLDDTTKFYFNTSAVPYLMYQIVRPDGSSYNETSEFSLDDNGPYRILMRNNGTAGVISWMVTQTIKSASLLGIILGSVFGVIGFIIIVLIAVFVIRHFLRNRYPHAKEPDQDSSPVIDAEANGLNQSVHRRQRSHAGGDDGIIDVVTLDPNRRKKPDSPVNESRNDGGQPPEQPKPSDNPSIQQVQSEVREVKF